MTGKNTEMLGPKKTPEVHYIYNSPPPGREEARILLNGFKNIQNFHLSERKAGYKTKMNGSEKIPEMYFIIRFYFPRC